MDDFFGLNEAFSINNKVSGNPGGVQTGTGNPGNSGFWNPGFRDLRDVGVLWETGISRLAGPGLWGPKVAGQLRDIGSLDLELRINFLRYIKKN